MTSTANSSTMDRLNWRAAIKKYDANKKLSDEQVELLVETARMAPTSYGLQLVKLYVVSNDSVKKQLMEAGYHQPQFVDASHTFVLAVRDTVTPEDIQEYVDRIAKQRSVPAESIDGLKGMMMGSIKDRSPQELFAWNSRQAYILLGMMMAVAADQNIDTTPIEGFVPEKFDEILGINKDGYKSVVVMPAGFRAEDDKYATMPKVRKTKEEFVKYVK